VSKLLKLRSRSAIGTRTFSGFGWVLKLNSRARIGARILGGFGLVLALLAAVSVLGYLGLSAIQTRFSAYQIVADNVSRVLKIDRDYVDLRRNTLTYTTSGDPQILDRVHELQKSIGEQIKEVTARLVIPEARERMTRVDGMFEELVVNQNLAAQKVSERNKLNGEMIAQGEKLHETLTAVRNTAMDHNDLATGANSGIALEALLRVRLDASLYVAKPDAKLAEAIKEEIAQLTLAFDRVIAAVKGSDQAARMQDVAPLLPQYRQVFENMSAAVSEITRLRTQVNTKTAEAINKELDTVREVQAANLKTTQATIAATSTSTIAQSAVVSGVALVLGAMLAGLISLGITRPVRAMTNAMTTLAGGNVGVEIPARDNTDEVGEMARAVQVFKDNMIETERLRGEQEEQKRRTEQQQRQAMREMADSFEAAVGDIVREVSSQADELQATAQSMSATAEETERQSATVAAASEQAASNVQTVASAAEELSSSIAEISRQVATSSEMTARAVEDTRRTNEEIQGLAEAAQSIGDVVKMINDIASQTNLLALNATIEAARAGDAGKGFAVVASEVKSLANQTAKATEEVRGKIAEMQVATTHSVEAVRDIGETIRRINEIVTSIADAVEQQGAATQEIARNVQQTSLATTEVSANIVGVTKAANDTGAASTQVLGTAGELAQQSQILRSQVDNFLGNIRAA
jgi:methyl-accepting chemotaxis protein